MQEKELTGDALLALDAQYVASNIPQEYFAYPSRAVPRFLIPVGDRVAERFVLRMLLADRPLLIFLTKVPLISRLFAWLLFRQKL